MTTSLVLAVILVAIVVFAIGIYNALVKLGVDAEGSWSDIDTQLKRRFDLVPNLVETVKGYAAHESKVFEEVTRARSQAMQASGPAAISEADLGLTGALKSLFAIAENYPQLRADSSFMQLQTSLNEVEDNINKARRYYNAVVREYNTKRESFPSNLIAAWFHFTAKDFFELDSEEEKKNVKVEFQPESSSAASEDR